MNYFDCDWNGELVNKGPGWFHNMPLPDGSRIAGANHDRNREQKLWEAFKRIGMMDVKDKDVLDIGANDGIMSIGAKLAGAKHVTAVNPRDVAINFFPENLNFAKKEWDLDIEVIVGTFLDLDDKRKYDLILYFGVLYHAEDPVGHFRKMKSLLKDGGAVLMETPLTRITNVDKPILEVASDTRFTTILRGQEYVEREIGLGTFFIPNFMAIQELSWTAGFVDVEQLPDDNIYTNSLKDRKLFVIK